MSHSCFMRRLENAFGLGLVSLLMACGGGDATDTAYPASPPFTEQSTATALSRDLGGTLQLDGLQLAVPPQAVGTAGLDVTLRTQAPADGALAAFQFAPAGGRLRQDATLTFSRAGLPAQARFFWVVDGQHRLLPGRVSGDTLTSTIAHLGLLPGMQRQAVAAPALARPALGPNQRPQSAQARALADGDPGTGQLEVRLLACRQQIDDLELRFRTLRWERDTEVALVLFDEYQALKSDCAELNNAAVIARACAALTQASDDAQVLAADSFENFHDIAARLAHAGGLVQLAGGDCAVTGGLSPDAHAAQTLAAKFDQFLDFVEARLQRAGLSDSLTQRDLALLFTLGSDCHRLELDAMCTRITNSLYPKVLDMMRTSAFESCRNGSNQSVAVLRALGLDNSSVLRFYGFANYSPDDLVRDAAYCRDASLSLRTFHLAGGIPDELAARRVERQVLGSLGKYLTDVSIKVPLSGSLTLGARIPVLHCPDDTVVRDELVLALGGREVARYSQSGETYTLATQSVDWIPEVELPRVGLAAKPGAHEMTLNREAGACADATALPSPRMTLFVIALAVSDEKPEAPPPVVLKPASWVGEITVAQSFSINWAQVHDTADSLSCGFLGSGGTCRVTGNGSLSGDTQTVWSMASQAPTLPGTAGFLLPELKTISAQLSRSTEGSYTGQQGDCRRSGESTSTDSGQSAGGGIQRGAWSLGLGMDGAFTLIPGRHSQLVAMTSRGGRGSSSISSNCSVPAGNNTSEFVPGRPTGTIELQEPLQPAITGRVDPQSGVLSGSASNTSTMTGSSCETFLAAVPPIAMGAKLTVSCSVTMTLTWRLTRQ